MPNNIRTPRNPESSHARRWQDLAEKRLRFAWATGIFGFLAGCVFMLVVAMPPMWMVGL